MSFRNAGKIEKKKLKNPLELYPFLSFGDLSKAFDFLKHELHISKLNAYGFSFPALKLIHDYLSDRK